MRLSVLIGIIAFSRINAVRAFSLSDLIPGSRSPEEWKPNCDKNDP